MTNRGGIGRFGRRVSGTLHSEAKAFYRDSPNLGQQPLLFQNSYFKLMDLHPRWFGRSLNGILTNIPDMHRPQKEEGCISLSS